MIFSAENAGVWELFTAEPSASSSQRLPASVFPARDPAVSPDGKTIAFRSRRDGTWEIYSMPLSAASATRLTRGMVYSGAPAWSPDGRKLAFESYARDDLDIWMMNADGSQPTDLTVDSRFYDYGPAWSPDGKWIAFTSWRTGMQQIHIVAADCRSPCRATNISSGKFDDQQLTWAPDGTKVAFVSDRNGQRAVYVADWANSELKNVRRLTFAGWDHSPTWAPDGKWIAFVSARPSRQSIYVVPSEGGMPVEIQSGPLYASSVTWASAFTLPGDSAAGTRAPLFPVQPEAAAPGSGYSIEMRRMTTVRLDPGINKLNSRVADSYIALQARVKQELGYDFLGTLAEMLRPLDLKCDITCDTLSWHKAGRAFDTRLDYSDSRGNALEVVREDMLGNTYWRVYLRAISQDGTQGEPMKEAPWDLSYRARWVIGPGEGGTRKQVPYGFWVDFTELARQYGWGRISAHDAQDFNWQTNKIAAEYWHFQKTEGLNWYQAITQVYPPSDLAPLDDWDILISKYNYDPYLLYLKGIPAPAKDWRWRAVGP